jgi:hypothetical protein
MLAHLLNGSTEVIVALFISAGVAIAVLLFLGYSLIAHLKTGPGIQIKRSILAHIVLHIVPASYVPVQFLIGTSLLINTIYLVPVILFFYTGRRTWEEMFRQFGRKVYRIYYFGNTAFMLVLPILLSFGFLIDESFGTEGFRQAMMSYISIHFLVTGLTMICIEKDILDLNVNTIAR